MLYTSEAMESQAILSTASRMCAAARTAPKAHGVDDILTLVLTGAEKDALADKMEEIYEKGPKEQILFFHRDANNLRGAEAVVLIGVKKTFKGLAVCSFCGFANCEACKAAGARCVFNSLDLGIALSSAAAVASADRVDNRIMFSVGKAATQMNYTELPGVLWHGIPLSTTGKNPFFDRRRPSEK